jgi:hypothetical protein
MRPVEFSSARGIELLLAHCAALAGGDERRPPARERLGEAVGDELARALVAALTGDKGRGRFQLAALGDRATHAVAGPAGAAA